MYTLESYFCYLSFANEKCGMENSYIWIEKLLESIFLSKSLFLIMRKYIESLLERGGWGRRAVVRERDNEARCQECTVH